MYACAVYYTWIILDSKNISDYTPTCAQSGREVEASRASREYNYVLRVSLYEAMNPESGGATTLECRSSVYGWSMAYPGDVLSRPF